MAAAKDLLSVDFTLIHPLTCQIVGGTQSGKTQLAVEIIRKRKEIISTPIDKVIYVNINPDFKVTDLMATDPNVIVVPDIFEAEPLITNPCLLILNDYLNIIETDVRSRQLVQKIFTELSHHCGCSVILILQNPFNKYLRTINLNTNYMVIFDIPRDKSCLNVIGRQLCPTRPKFLSYAFEKACENRKHCYILIDLHPKCPNPKLFVRDSVFPHNGVNIFV